MIVSAVRAPGYFVLADVPLLIWQVLGLRLNPVAMLCMSGSGVLLTVLWKYYGFPGTVYGGAVGMVFAFLLGGLLIRMNIR